MSKPIDVPMDDLLDLAFKHRDAHIEPAYDEGLAYLTHDGKTYRAELPKTTEENDHA